MNRNAVQNVFFKFEEDFVESNIRCIPMIVRFKLDACGIKLKLAEWSRMKPEDREGLVMTECETAEDILRYRENLRTLIIRHTGNSPTDIPVSESPAWSRTDEIPYTIKEKLQESASTFSLEQWQSLSHLQRFALLKLSYPGHENKNFPRAMAEFGLM
ncbi:MAG: nitrate reductase associated protein [Cyclobacteriaceae bacterium]